VNKSKKLILIKLGGSLITDKNKPFIAKPALIRRLAKEIKIAWDKGYRFLIVHGSGSFGHTSAAKYGTVNGIKNKKSVYGLAVVQQDAFKINRIVNKIFLETGLPVLSFMPSSFSFAQDKKLKKIFVEPIVKALKIDTLPLVFGDVIMDEKNGCCIFSGETTLDNLITPLHKNGFRVDKIIQCGITDGVYDQNGETIPKITPGSFPKLAKLFGESKSTDVTGGMIHKIEESLKIAGLGINTFIINGQVKNNLLKVIEEKKIIMTLISS
jgi:isopentenyl phosphate kinase